ncbi:general odorant-binding protein 99a-like [Bactrocera neohumeralis]|uniref:general odorant-binding protein 99a-like n=1 Tax=Bactrocera tryoni TaxID=59916 RepID=UPI001A95D306|nr:general odorant-binding protein 99a-like [Bactrocera tryoni]XP_050326320.1 general odorant-binding protein 99a-like [Bactrocera neohumeralis]
MKYFMCIVILAVIALVQADHWSPKTVDDIKNIREECMKEVPSTDEEFEKRKENDYPDVESVRKYMLCTSKAWGLYKEGKGFNADRVAEQFKDDMPEDEIKAIIHDCDEKTKEDTDDERCYHILKCACSTKLGDHIKDLIKRSE